MEHRKNPNGGNMKKPEQITYNELMKGLDQFRERSSRAKPITKEQKEFLIKCRKNPKPISYYKMAQLWSKVWSPIGRTTIWEKCEKIGLVESLEKKPL